MGERSYRQVCGQRGRNVTTALAILPTNALIFHVAFLGGMTGQRQDKISTQTNIWFSHNNPAITGPNSELKKLPPYGPFLNIMEQAISALKAAFTADISYPEQQKLMNNRADLEATRQGMLIHMQIALLKVRPR